MLASSVSTTGATMISVPPGPSPNEASQYRVRVVIFIIILIAKRRRLTPLGDPLLVALDKDGILPRR